MELKWKSCLRAGVTVIILFLMIHYWTDFVSVAGIALGAAVPLFLGCVIAYTVNIPMTFIEKYLQKLCQDTQAPCTVPWMLHPTIDHQRNDRHELLFLLHP